MSNAYRFLYNGNPTAMSRQRQQGSIEKGSWHLGQLAQLDKRLIHSHKREKH